MTLKGCIIVVILSIATPAWTYLMFRLISAAWFKSWLQAIRKRKQEEKEDGPNT